MNININIKALANIRLKRLQEPFHGEENGSGLAGYSDRGKYRNDKYHTGTRDVGNGKGGYECEQSTKQKNIYDMGLINKNVRLCIRHFR